jgi:hypothetical protein
MGLGSNYIEMLGKIRDEERAAGYRCPDCGTPEGHDHDARCLHFQRAAINEAARTGDLVNSPPHYTDGGIETIDYIEAKLTREQFEGYCLGNALKYISRAGKKSEGDTDIRKAVWYLKRMLGE